MTKNSLHASSSYFFLLISVIIMICKSHFGEHLTTVKLSVCFIGTVTSLRQKWCSLPVWHQVEGLCLATDNNSVHIAIIFLLSFRSPRLSKLPGWVLKDGSTFLDKVTVVMVGIFLPCKKLPARLGACAAGAVFHADSSQRFLCVPLPARMSLQSRTFWNKMLIVTLRLQR